MKKMQNLRKMLTAGALGLALCACAGKAPAAATTAAPETTTAAPETTTTAPETTAAEKKEEASSVAPETTTAEVKETEGETKEETSAEAEKKDTSKVAGAGETIAYADVVDENAVKVTVDQLQDGTYEIAVDSSSSMFRIASCELTVKDGVMTALLNTGSKSYLWLYPGTAEEAAAQEESKLIGFEESADGSHAFRLPVEALNEGLPFAAFSGNKDKWYDRTLVFRADSLPSDAFSESFFVTAESLGLKDGMYTAEATLNGGSGKASVKSPAEFTVKDGKATALVEFSSKNYDYVLKDGEKYLPVNTEGNSVFELPLTAFDFGMAITADTVAMGTPHEIDYTLTFDSASIKQTE